MIIKTTYNIGDFVFLITDIEKQKRMITNITISKDAHRYGLMFGTVESWHYDYEIENYKNNINGRAGFFKNNNHEKEKEKTTV